MKQKGINVKTQLQKSKSFYPAEEEHQQYNQKRMYDKICTPTNHNDAEPAKSGLYNQEHFCED